MEILLKLMIWGYLYFILSMHGTAGILSMHGTAGAKRNGLSWPQRNLPSEVYFGEHLRHRTRAADSLDPCSTPNFGSES